MGHNKEALRKLDEEATRSIIDLIWTLKEKSKILINNNEFQLASVILNQALNMGEEYLNKGIKILLPHIKEISGLINEVNRRILELDNTKILVESNISNQTIMSIKEALKEIDSIDHFEVSNFITFENHLHDYMQFLKLLEDKWAIDIPMFHGDTFVYSLNYENLTTFQVKLIVFNFTKGNFPLRILRNLMVSVRVQKQKFEKIMESIPSELNCQYCGYKVEDLTQNKCNFCNMTLNYLIDFKMSEK